MIPPDAQSIWDICCDHGYLGRAILKDPPPQLQELHFLDQVPRIIDRLQFATQQESQEYKIPFHIHLHDGRAFQFPQVQVPTVFCIAGVGFHTVKDIMSAIIAANKRKRELLYFLIGSHKQNFTLRKLLSSQGWRCQLESLIHENGHYRELWLVSLEGERFSKVGLPQEHQEETWLQYWTQEHQRMMGIIKKGGTPEIPPDLLEQHIAQYS